MFIFACLYLTKEYSLSFPNEFNFRMPTTDGWMGPKTRWQGNNGYLVKITTAEELTNHIANKHYYSETLLLPTSLVTDEILTNLENNFKPIKYLRAIIMYPTGDANVSSAPRYPNQKYSYHKEDYDWNPYGSGSDRKQHSFDIYQITSEEYLAAFLALMNAFPEESGVYINNRQYSRGNFKKSYTTKKSGNPLADPVSGVNIYGSFDANFTGPAVWAIASIDSFGLTPYNHVGADRSMSGFIGLLAALRALQNLTWSEATKPLRYIFFDTEEFAYSGSERFLYDIANFKCQTPDSDNSDACSIPYRAYMGFKNITLDDFDTVIELQSIGLYNDSSKLFAHSEKEVNAEFLSNVTSVNYSGVSISQADSDLPGVPPSSMNSFLKYKNRTFNHVVLTGFNRQYVNKNIGMPDDSYNNIDIDYMTKAATNTARLLAKLCFPDLPEANLSSIVADKDMINQTLYGFAVNPNASSIFLHFWPLSEKRPQLSTVPGSIYTGVSIGYSYRTKHQFIKMFMDETKAAKYEDVDCSDSEKVNCSKIDPELKCGWNNRCVKSNVEFSPALYPGLEFDYDDYKYNVSTWDNPYFAETRWNNQMLYYVTLGQAYIGRYAIFVGVLLWLILAIGGAKLWSWNLTKLSK